MWWQTKLWITSPSGRTDELQSGQCLWQSTSPNFGGTGSGFSCKVQGSTCVTSLSVNFQSFSDRCTVNREGLLSQCWVKWWSWCLFWVGSTVGWVVVKENQRKISPSVIFPINVAYSKCPLLTIVKVQLRLRSSVHYSSFLPAEVGKSFFAGKNLVTAKTQLRLYSEQQRAFGISNICHCRFLLGVMARYLCLIQVESKNLLSQQDYIDPMFIKIFIFPSIGNHVINCYMQLTLFRS